MSFRPTLSNFITNVYHSLFPAMEKHLGELSELHKRLIAILELVRIEEYLASTKFKDGRPPKDRAEIARAFIAKVVFKINYNNQLLRNIKADMQLREICGWTAGSKIPSESKLSRVFDEFAESGFPEKVHQALIKELYNDQTVAHVIKDSTPIEARESFLRKAPAHKRNLKAVRRKAKKAGELNRRQKQLGQNLEEMINDLPKSCDKGMKKSAQGYTVIWKGYKLHAAVDDHCVPLAAIITSASLNDCEAGIPLAQKCHQVAKNRYDLMDAAYDHPEIKEHSLSLGHIPLIDKCPHSSAQKIEKEAERKRKRILNFKTADEVRYNERFSKERFNALYKDYHGGRAIFYRGYKKISCHVMFGILTLAASIIISHL